MHGNNSRAGVDPIFFAPLVSSLVPARAGGSPTPTFSRATTAYVRDQDGIQRAVLTNEARFVGARRVENLLTFTQDFTNATWGRTNIPVPSSGVADPFGGTNANKIVDDGTNALHGLSQTAVALTASRTFLWSVYLRAAEQSNPRVQFADGASANGIYATVNLSAGTLTGVTLFGAATGALSQIQSVDGGYYRVTIGCTMPSGATANPFTLLYLNDAASYAGAGQGVFAFGGMLQNVTGQSVTTVATYVSKNVLSAPYQGANVDGVQYFISTLAGAAIPASTLRGFLSEAGNTNWCIWSNDLTNAAWGKGATMTAALTATGPDGIPNSASTLTATSGVLATNIVTQAIVRASAQRCTSAFVRRRTGSGTIEMTQDAGTTWTVITTTAAWQQLRIPAQTIANPTLGFRITTNGDQIDVWCTQNEEGAVVNSSPIPTTTVAVARNVEPLSYPVAGNYADAAGTCYVEWIYETAVAGSWPIPNVRIVGSDNGPSGALILFPGDANVGGVNDGTNAASSVCTAAINTLIRTITAWQNAGTIEAQANGGALGSLVTNTYDGSFSLTEITVGHGVGGVYHGNPIKNLKIFGVKLPAVTRTAMVS